MEQVKIIVLLKYQSNFWKTLEMLLINCEIDLTSTWSENYYVKVNPIDDQEPTFIITDTKIYVPVVTLSTFLLVIRIFYLVNSCFALSLENNAH